MAIKRQMYKLASPDDRKKSSGRSEEFIQGTNIPDRHVKSSEDSNGRAGK